MGKIWEAFKNWLDETKMEMNFLKIEDYYRKAGSESPRMDAIHELHIRAEVLERFRDEASRAYLKKGTNLHEFRSEWIKRNLSSKYSHLDTKWLAKARNAVNAMPADEAYHGEALVKHKREFAKWLEEMREQNRKRNGPTGWSPLQRRVLRGKV